ncbi:MAG: methylenetetrahydrofolate--tRNA-(uracil(54)-C(5))-methyltransferase (FADH(2)-oxidizing) TrmFO, partial [Deltaproteobacteria bacterium]|nr:methylenetetrahydrofolate--tRNA-(uracil(54)-C(5))-methyltransferase (FADH(2)-oxidizing) TrmFO [Deltaproteobacteria bacterium]
MIDDDGSKPWPVPRVAVVGGGLAGCEACWALARRGIGSVLFEMKPSRFSPAHCQPGLAELVCSNSLRSREETSAVGLLKLEMAELGSLVMEAAEVSVVPAGKALAVDRRLFSNHVTSRLEAEPLVRIVRREVLGLDDSVLDGFDKVIVTAGPLASESLTVSLERLVGSVGLYFYDAIAPIVVAASVDMSRAFWASRYNPEEKDYLNCPMDEAEYMNLVMELRSGRRVSARDFEDEIHFEGCLPVEAMADRG